MAAFEGKRSLFCPESVQEKRPLSAKSGRLNDLGRLKVCEFPLTVWVSYPDSHKAFS